MKSPATGQSQWRIVDISPPWEPDWLDANHEFSPIMYEISGVFDQMSDANLEANDKTMSLTLKKGELKLLLCSWLIIPFTALASYHLGVGPVARFVFPSLFILGGTFGCIYFYLLRKRHEDLGDYLYIDRVAKVIRLPRQKLKFSFDDVIGFQWIERKQSADFHGQGGPGTYLSLLVREDKQKIQYHICGHPRRDHVQQVVEFSGIPIDELAGFADRRFHRQLRRVNIVSEWFFGRRHEFRQLNPTHTDE